MPLFFHVPLPGPFSYSKRIGGRRRRRPTGGSDLGPGGVVAVVIVTLCVLAGRLWPIVALAAGFVALGYWAQTHPDHPIVVRARQKWDERKAAKRPQASEETEHESAQPSPLIQPTSSSDPFCTCPSCRGLANHEVSEERTWRRRTVPGQNGDSIDVSGFGDPVEGTRYVERRCVLCQHTWITTHPEVA